MMEGNQAVKTILKSHWATSRTEYHYHVKKWTL